MTSALFQSIHAKHVTMLKELDVSIEGHRKYEHPDYSYPTVNALFLIASLLIAREAREISAVTNE